MREFYNVAASVKVKMGSRRLLKRFGILRVPHALTRSAERKIINEINSPPFVLSHIEDSERIFQKLAR